MHLQEKEIIDCYIRSAFAEDQGEGDHTSLACIPVSAKGEAFITAKESGVIAGIEIARRVFYLLDPSIRFTAFVKDGQGVRKGKRIAEISGLTQKLLLGERLSLNYMQRMSGIATQTRKMVKRIEGTGTVLLDTRKTTPNNRIFEKMAVLAGGAQNHRFGLYDMIMIKDNHIDFAGGIPQAIERTKAYLKKNKKKLAIEIEVRNFEELDQVLACGDIQRIMLDNFTPEDLRRAVKKIKGRYQTEASGGITEKNIQLYAFSGLDFISMGALTHHVKSMDLSMCTK